MIAFCLNDMNFKNQYKNSNIDVDSRFNMEACSRCSSKKEKKNPPTKKHTHIDKRRKYLIQWMIFFSIIERIHLHWIGPLEFNRTICGVYNREMCEPSFVCLYIGILCASACNVFVVWTPYTNSGCVLKMHRTTTSMFVMRKCVSRLLKHVYLLVFFSLLFLTN